MPTYKCLQCGASFDDPRPSAKRKFCSSSCAAKYNGMLRVSKTSKLEQLTFTAEQQGAYMDIKFSRKPSRYTIERLNALGYRFDWRYGSWRSKTNHQGGVEIARMACEMSARYNRANRSTLCWTCDHADKGGASECPWVSEFKPVDGWDADEQTRRLWDHQQDGRNVPRTVTSYCVISCPLYVMDKRTKKRSKK